MTSAIPEMSVAQVRKALGDIRKAAQIQTEETPFFITDSVDDLPHNLSIQSFCLKFVCGHHDKRHNKGKKKTPNRDRDEEDID